MRLRQIAVTAVIVVSAVPLYAQGPGELAPREFVPNWTAPSVWSPERAVSPVQDSGVAGTLASSPVPFIAITPCRIVDTRVGFGFPSGYGPPALSPGAERSFDLVNGPCPGLSPEVVAYSLNITAVGPAGPGHLVIWPTGSTPPNVSSINYTAGQTIANAVIVPAGNNGAVSVVAGVSGTNLLVDINGYYAAAVTGGDNTFLGFFAGNDATSGNGNTGIGYLALNANTSGSFNSALGSFALYSNHAGANNAAVGYAALAENDIGHDNTALGGFALNSNVNGHFNTAVGTGTLTDNLSGATNTAIGYNALHFATGSNNIAIGSLAGDIQQGGSNNIYIGNRGNASLPGESGQIRIGTVGVHTAGIVIVGIHGFGSSGGIPVIVNAGGRLGTTQSSRRVKEQIRDVASDSAGLMRLRPVSFKYKPEVDEAGLTQYGLIAEEVAEVYPELVVSDSKGRPEAVRYQLLDALLLNELQEQHRNLEAQRAEIERLKAELAKIKASVRAETTP
jgi:uncharacterized small protein (DUF1192 family)